eukprot:7894409-Karenia_brevis.AAC.1
MKKICNQFALRCTTVYVLPAHPHLREPVESGARQWVKATKAKAKAKSRAKAWVKAKAKAEAEVEAK